MTPKRLNTLDDADYDTPDYPLDNLSSSSATPPSSTTKAVFETTLRMKLACLQSVTLRHLGLHVDSDMPVSTPPHEVRFEAEKVIEREEWRLATKGLCRAMVFDTPQMVVRKLVATMHMITHAVDAYIRNPITVTLSLKCSECGQVHTNDTTTTVSHIGRRISLKEREIPSKELSADDLMPGIAFAIIQANPPGIDTSIWYAAEFRHPDLLYGEESYWLSQLQSAVEFCRAVLTHSLFLTHSLTHAYPPTHALTHSLTYSLTHSLTHSITHSLPVTERITYK